MLFIPEGARRLIGYHAASLIVSINKLTKSTHSAPSSIDPAGWISQAEAARLRSVTRQAIAKLVGSGRLRTVVIGGRAFVSRADVVAFEPLPPGRPKRTDRE